MQPIADAGFDGLEVWDGHILHADDQLVDVVDGPIPVVVFNSYCGFGGDDAAARMEAAAWVRRCHASGVKFNVGPDADEAVAYAERLSDWIDELPDGVAALCECHDGISIADDPVVAAKLFDAAGPPARLQAIVHTHDDADLLRAKFDAYGDRISHVHVNFLDPKTASHPTLEDAADRLHDTVDVLRSLGFRGSWTLEFVAGLLSARDEPGALLEQAAADLPVLRSAIEGGSGGR